MFYGCEFYVTDNCVVLTSKFVTSAQYEQEGANEALHAYNAYKENLGENICFAVVYFDDYDFEVCHLLLDEKFLNDDSIKKIEASLKMKYLPSVEGVKG